MVNAAPYGSGHARQGAEPVPPLHVPRRAAPSWSSGRAGSRRSASAAACRWPRRRCNSRCATRGHVDDRRDDEAGAGRADARAGADGAAGGRLGGAGSGGGVLGQSCLSPHPGHPPPGAPRSTRFPSGSNANSSAVPSTARCGVHPHLVEQRRRHLELPERQRIRDPHHPRRPTDRVARQQSGLQRQPIRRQDHRQRRRPDDRRRQAVRVGLAEVGLLDRPHGREVGRPDPVRVPLALARQAQDDLLGDSRAAGGERGRVAAGDVRVGPVAGDVLADPVDQQDVELLERDAASPASPGRAGLARRPGCGRPGRPRSGMAGRRRSRARLGRSAAASARSSPRPAVESGGAMSPKPAAWQLAAPACLPSPIATILASPLS